MDRTRMMVALAVLSLGIAAAQSVQPLDLLPDESLKGWTRVPIPPVDGLKPPMQWRVDVANRMLICTGTGGHEWLRSDREFGDFVLDVDWRFAPREAAEKKYNSGIGIRLSRFGEIWYQAQTGLTGGYLFGQNIADGLMARFNLSKEMKENRVKPAGEWNHYQITAKGGTITLAVNGEVVNELHDVGFLRGYIGFEAEGYEIAFRNIKLSVLD